MSFLAYDLTFLGIFIVLLGIFLYRKRKNLKREGLLLLYKESWGIKLIHRVGKKYQKTLKILSYISVTLGYLLMAGCLYLIGRIVWIYTTQGAVVRAIKIPPIMPLVPYLPQIFKLSFLPPFYFTYWIIIIAVIAITHELAHGVFAARKGVKIKSTGFGFFPFFLPIFLAAFVELDEKRMAKKKTFDQLAILSAGTFANTLTAILFFIILVAFFSLAFAPSGVVFDTYPYATINTSSIKMINNVSVISPSYQKVVSLINNNSLNEIRANSNNYVSTMDSILQQNSTPDQLMLYYDGPAIRANLESTILDVNGMKITNLNDLSSVIQSNPPGTNITLTVLGSNNSAYNRTITLGQSPDNKNLSWLGIAFYQTQNTGIISQFYSELSSFDRNHIYYASKIGDSGIFIYNLLWWLIIISISVALINMLPMGIFDGGRFFYLTVLAITKKEKAAEKAFKFATYFFIFLLFAVMALWLFYIK